MQLPRPDPRISGFAGKKYAYLSSSRLVDTDGDACRADSVRPILAF